MQETKEKTEHRHLVRLFLHSTCRPFIEWADIFYIRRGEGGLYFLSIRHSHCSSRRYSPFRLMAISRALTAKYVCLPRSILFSVFFWQGRTFRELLFYVQCHQAFGQSHENPKMLGLVPVLLSLICYILSSIRCTHDGLGRQRRS